MTIDVKSLYLHIPHGEGIDSALQHLFGEEQHRSDIPFPREFARTLFRAILEHNIFEFDGRMHKQIQGTAMGTKMAPVYANLFLDTFERKFLEDQPLKPEVWRRYIDDILCFWQGTMADLESFLQRLNVAHPTLCFTWEVSDEKAIFLDLEIYKGDRFRSSGKLDTKLFLKKNTMFQYLPYDSGHPRAVLKGLIKG